MAIYAKEMAATVFIRGQSRGFAHHHRDSLMLDEHCGPPKHGLCTAKKNSVQFMSCFYHHSRLGEGEHQGIIRELNNERRPKYPFLNSNLRLSHTTNEERQKPHL